MYMQTNKSSSAYSFDHSKSWTENCRIRAYWRLAATDEQILEFATRGIAGPPSGSSEAASLIKWERDEAAETVKYFETEHDQVVAEAKAARPRPLT